MLKKYFKKWLLPSNASGSNLLEKNYDNVDHNSNFVMVVDWHLKLDSWNNYGCSLLLKYNINTDSLSPGHKIKNISVFHFVHLYLLKFAAIIMH